MEYKLLLQYNLQFFAQEGPGGEKTEEPTSKRLREARDKGQVAKSKEIAQAASLLTFFILLRFTLSWLGLNFERYFAGVYNQFSAMTTMTDGLLPMAQMERLFRQMIISMMTYLAPFFAIGVLVAFISDIVQVGWKLVTEPFKPKLSKMNPINGLKKIISKESLFGLLLAILKIAVISIVVYTYLMGRNESLFLLYDMPLRQGIELMGDIIIEMGIRISVVYMIVALIDWIYQK
ncbi:MAG: EscU/YscU/HrcU family type III secretion system export apparatus switch protein, partial [Lachnospiraceae bacterium]|nr:EscU/YscU/HrcU family type III secretion system export apparatus switch protein [Lachnospiraceae bacterium]